MVAESVRDDGGGHLKELLPDGGAAGGSHWDADLVEEHGQTVGGKGWPDRRPGNSQGDAWLMAVFMWPRSAM
ncbi:hypothetical protein GCM10018773_36080 [Streptomyces candidus]|nr:hypothetical protein GCM10018773_36080 [Streptomyces candidus]